MNEQMDVIKVAGDAHRSRVLEDGYLRRIEKEKQTGKFNKRVTIFEDRWKRYAAIWSEYVHYTVGGKNKITQQDWCKEKNKNVLILTNMRNFLKTRMGLKCMKQDYPETSKLLNLSAAYKIRLDSESANRKKCGERVILGKENKLERERIMRRLAESEQVDGMLFIKAYALLSIKDEEHADTVKEKKKEQKSANQREQGGTVKIQSATISDAALTETIGIAVDTKKPLVTLEGPVVTNTTTTIAVQKQLFTDDDIHKMVGAKVLWPSISPSQNAARPIVRCHTRTNDAYETVVTVLVNCEAASEVRALLQTLRDGGYIVEEIPAPPVV